MRWGLLGAGTVGRLRAEALARLPGATLVAVADPDRDRARAAAAQSGARAVGDPAEVLDRDDVEAVVVSTPVHLHEEQTIAALAAGRHVLCEKPLAADPAACRRMVAAAEEAGRVLATGFDYRYFPAVRFLAGALAAGRVGRLDHLRVFGGHEGLPNLHARWMYEPELSGGGAAMDIGLHTLDLLRHVAGEVRLLAARATADVWGIDGSEDDAVALLETADGRPVTYQATWSEWTGYRFAVEAYGAGGMVRAAYAPMAHLLVEQQRPGGPRRVTRRRYPWIAVREKLGGWQTTTRRAFAAELRDLPRRAAGEEVPLASGIDGARAVELAWEIAGR